MKHLPKILLILGSIAAAKVVAGAVPGALESFPALDHARSWSVYDYADDTVYYPEWWDDGDPYLYSFHSGDAGLWFLTDSLGSSAWLGDYQTEDIQSIKADIFIDTLEDFSELDCAVWTNGPAGWQYYYSESFFDSDFPDSGWWELTFDLDAVWYYYDSAEGWFSVEMNAAHFQEVEEIGFRFFPWAGTTEPLLAAIDEVRLEPLVDAPALSVSSTEEDFLLEFTPLKANSSFIEKLSSHPSPAWEAVPGQTNITGPAAHLFSTPLTAPRGIFRVTSEAQYTQVTLD